MSVQAKKERRKELEALNDLLWSQPKYILAVRKS